MIVKPYLITFKKITNYTNYIQVFCYALQCHFIRNFLVQCQTISFPFRDIELRPGKNIYLFFQLMKLIKWIFASFSGMSLSGKKLFLKSKNLKLDPNPKGSLQGPILMSFNCDLIQLINCILTISSYLCMTSSHFIILRMINVSKWKSI